MVTLSGADPRMIANNIEPFCNIHPGMVVKDELDYLNLSAADAAEKMGVDVQAIEDVLNEKAPMTSELAMMFEALLGLPSEDLVQFQKDYDMLATKRDKRFMKKLSSIRRVAAVL